MYSFKAKHQVMVLPWCRSFLRFCSGLILCQIGISSYLLWGGDSVPAMAVVLTLLMLTGSSMWWMFQHGKARLYGEQLTVWTRGSPKKRTNEYLNVGELNARYVDFRYIESFQAQLQYVSSLDQISAARQACPSPIYFKGGLLKPWQTDHLDAFYALFSDGELMAWHDVHEHSLAEAHQRVVYSSTHDQFRSFWTYMLMDESGVLCGHVEMRLIGAKGRLGEISFGLLAPYRGQGYMTKALLALIQYWTNEHGVEQIAARTKLSNRSCRRLLERLGFVPNNEVFSESVLGVCESSELTLAWQKVR